MEKTIRRKSVNLKADSDLESSTELTRSAEFPRNTFRNTKPQQQTQQQQLKGDVNKNKQKSRSHESVHNTATAVKENESSTLQRPPAVSKALSEGSIEVMDEKTKDKTTSKWKRVTKTALNKGKTETKTSKLRAELMASKLHREGTEDRIRTMEHKKEVESLKRYTDELKAEILKLQEKSKLKDDKLNQIINERKFTEDGQTFLILNEKVEKDRQENLNRVQNQFEQIIRQREQLSKEFDDLKMSNQQLETDHNKLKLDLEVSEAIVSSLQTERMMQDMNLKMTAEDLEKRKEEIENLRTLYEEKFQENEEERQSIENENKKMIDSLKTKCDSNKEVESKLESTEKFVEEQNIALDDLIQLVSMLEIEKGKKDDEIKKLEEEKDDLQKQMELKMADIETLQTEIQQKLVEIQSLNGTMTTLKSSIDEKDLSLNSFHQSIDELKLSGLEKVANIERLVEEKKIIEHEKEACVKNLEDELEKAANLNQEKEKGLQEKIEELNAQLKQISQLQSEVEDLTIALSEKDADIKTVCVELEDSKKEITALKQDAEESTKENAKTISDLMKNTGDEKAYSKLLSSQLELKTNEFLQKTEKLKSDFDIQLKIAEEQLSKKRLELENVNENLEHKTSEISVMKNKIEELVVEKKNLIDANKSMETKYKDEMKILKDMLAVSTAESTAKDDTFHEKILQHGQEIEECKNHSDEIEKHYKNNEQLLKTEIENVEAELLKTQNQYEATLKKFEQSRQENENVCQKLLNMTNENTKLNEDIENLQSNVNCFEEINRKNDLKLSQLKLDNRELLKQQQNIQKHLEDAQNLNKRDNEEKEELITKKERELENQKELLTSKTNKNDIQSSTIKLLNEKLNKTSEEIMKLEMKKEDLKSELNIEKTAHVTSQTNNQKLINDLQMNLEKSKHRINELENEHQHLQQLKLQYETDIKKIKFEYDLLNDENTNTLNNLKMIQKDKKNLEAELLKEKDRHALQNSKKDLNHQNQISRMLSDFHLQSRKYDSTIKEKEIQIKHLLEQVERLKEKVRSRDDNLDMLKMKTDDETYQLQIKAKELEDKHKIYLQNEIDRLQNEYHQKVINIQTGKDKAIKELENMFEDIITKLETKYSITAQELHTSYEEKLNNTAKDNEHLIKTLQRLESLNLQQKIDFRNEIQSLREQLRQKTKDCFHLQSQCEKQKKAAEKILTDIKRDGRIDHSKEILEVLNKLERQFNDKFANAKVLTISQPGSTICDDSLLDETCALSVSNKPYDLNTTWPPNTSLIIPTESTFQQPQVKKHQRGYSEDSIRPASIRSSIDRAKFDLKLRLKNLERQNVLNLDLNNNIRKGESAVSPAQTPISPRSTASTSNILPCRRNHFKHRSTLTYPFVNSLSNGNRTDHNSDNGRRRSNQRDLDTTNLGDSGFTEQSNSFRNQINSINQELLKLDQECQKIKNIDDKHDEFLSEVSLWKNEMKERLDSLKYNTTLNPMSDDDKKDEADGLESSFSRCVLFHPSQSEVKSIIETVNKQYDTLKDIS